MILQILYILLRPSDRHYCIVCIEFSVSSKKYPDILYSNFVIVFYSFYSSLNQALKRDNVKVFKKGNLMNSPYFYTPCILYIVYT